MSTKTQGNHPLMGEVYMVAFDGVGSVQKGLRPALVFQNNVGNRYSPNVVVLPITTARKKFNQPTHVLISAKKGGMKADGMVLCENPQSISKTQLGPYITTFSEEDMKQVAIASLLANSAISYLDISILENLKEKATKLNVV